MMKMAEQRQEELKEGMEWMEQRVTSMAERAQDELKEAVEAGLTVIQDQVRVTAEGQEVKLKEIGKGVAASLTEQRTKTIAEILATITKVEKTVTAIATEQKNMAKLLAKRLDNVEKLRGELDDTHGAILELNRTMNDMQQSTREDLVNLIKTTTKMTSLKRDTTHIAKRWQRFTKVVRQPRQVTIHNGVKTDIVDLITPTGVSTKNNEELKPTEAQQTPRQAEVGQGEAAAVDLITPAKETREKYTAPPGFYNEWSKGQKEEWIKNNELTIRRNMPGGFGTEIDERETVAEDAQMVARAVRELASPSPICHPHPPRELQ